LILLMGLSKETESQAGPEGAIRPTIECRLTQISGNQRIITHARGDCTGIFAPFSVDHRQEKERKPIGLRVF
jgi:hypothetical protein